MDQAYWPKALPGNKVGYWVNDESYSKCYKLDLKTGISKEVCRTKHYLLDYNWDPTGRFVIGMTWSAVHGFLFIPNNSGLPIIWDSETNEQYILPQTTGRKYSQSDFKEKGILWISNNHFKDN